MLDLQSGCASNSCTGARLLTSFAVDKYVYYGVQKETPATVGVRYSIDCECKFTSFPHDACFTKISGMFY